MSQIKRYRKKKVQAEQNIKKIKSGIIKLSLIMLNFIFATFAWFTYTMILESNVDVNVSAWQIDFKDNNAVLGTSMEFEIGNFYPGMDDYTKEIEIENLGDRPASITYKIEKLKILDKEYQIKEVAEAGDPDNTLYKSEVTDANTGITTIKLLNDDTKFPFEILLTHTSLIDIKSESDEEQNKGTFKICFTWPYEVVVPEGETATEEQIATKNALDTEWGHDIAKFYSEQPEGAKGIEIKLQAIARQVI